MPVIKTLHEALRVIEQTHNRIVEAIPAEMVDAIKTQGSPNDIKAKCAMVVADRVSAYDPEECILIGIMVEQAYNAAVLHSQQKKPLFGKRK